MTKVKRPLRVFLSYASQDKLAVRDFARRLTDEGWIDVWVDEKKLLPGQDWRTKIEEAVETSDIVIICLSSNSVGKEGFVQKELRYAREIAFEKPDETIFLIPIRFNDCAVPRGLRFYQWGDYFGENKEQTFLTLLESLNLRYQQKLKLEEEADLQREIEKKRLELESIRKAQEIALEEKKIELEKAKLLQERLDALEAIKRKKHEQRVKQLDSIKNSLSILKQVFLKTRVTLGVGFGLATLLFLVLNYDFVLPSVTAIPSLTSTIAVEPITIYITSTNSLVPEITFTQTSSPVIENATPEQVPTLPSGYVRVPDLMLKDFAEAESILVSLGFKVKSISVVRSEFNAGVVVGQNLPSGGVYEIGETIVLYRNLYTESIGSNSPIIINMQPQEPYYFLHEFIADNTYAVTTYMKGTGDSRENLSIQIMTLDLNPIRSAFGVNNPYLAYSPQQTGYAIIKITQCCTLADVKIEVRLNP